MADNLEENSIQYGDKAVLKMGKIIHVVEIKSKKKYQLGKNWFQIDTAVGCPYGSTFEVKGSIVQRVSAEEDGDTALEKEAAEDNRNLFDSNENQKLSRDDIEDLKKTGASREDIVDQLIENSATFKEKTEFAQQKYIKKKKKKYQNRFMVFKPTIRLIAEMYFNKGPSKICCLRMDSLGQILTQGNVHANTRQLLVDGCNGLILACYMEKMAGYGTIVDFYTQDLLARPALSHFNFSEKTWKMVQKYPLSRVAELQCWSSRRNHKSSDCEPPTKKVKLEGNGEAKEEANTSENATASDDCKSEASQRREEQVKRREKRLQEVEETKMSLDKGGYDGLCVASREQPAPIVLSLLELLAPSRPVTVFCAQLEPLVECYMRLRDRGNVIGLRISETWMRNYQVLENRTHPEILMNNCGGYLLTATTTTSAEKSSSTQL